MMKDIIRRTIDNKDTQITQQIEMLSEKTKVSLLDLGVVKFEPDIPCDTSLVISCAIHGNETAPQELIQNMIDDLYQGKLECCQRVLFIFGNPWAMAAQQRFIDINMNRLFCQNWRQQDSSLNEVARAAKLESYVTHFFAEEPDTVKHRLHYDCHTSIRPSKYPKFAVYPFVEHRQLPESQVAFLAAAGIQSVMLQQKPSSTFSSFTSTHHRAESFTLELGKVAPYGENDLSQFSDIDFALRDLIAGKRITAKPQKTVDVFEVCHEIIKTSEQWQFNIEDSAPNFTRYEKGYTVWKDKRNQYTVQHKHEYIAFPNIHVPVGQRAGLMLKRQ